MKKAFQKLWQNYFNFTKGERNAFFVLSFIIVVFSCVTFLIPNQYPWAKTDFSELEKYEISPLIDTIEKKEFEDYKHQYAEYPKAKNYSKGERFNFNPNTSSLKDFERLGLPNYVAQRIIKFRAAGAVFYIKSDLKKIYGLDENLYNELYPFISLTETKTFVNKPFDNKPDYKPKTFTLIDINTADTATLNRLPGIGNVLSLRIVTFRDKLGGFHSLEQLTEVYGLKPEVIEKINLKLRPEISILKYVFINTASAMELADHPYIKKKLADIIVNYRSQHGNFKTIDDLKKIKTIDEDNFNKLKVYIKL